MAEEVVVIRGLSVRLRRGESQQFIAELENLCKKYTGNGKSPGNYTLSLSSVP